MKVAVRQVRVLLADDSPRIREALRGLLGSWDGLSVVAEASDGREALAKVEKAQPDVLVLDLHMPGMGALEVLNALKGATGSTAAVIVISCDAAEKYRSLALSSGAFGFLAKDDLGALPEMILEATKSSG
ncbi:MAG TPA: response regulator transcription factor [Dehalococcoidia bacterium]|nr:response regulator transcription factor [Dehalococcoidia bacterium]